MKLFSCFIKVAEAILNFKLHERETLWWPDKLFIAVTQDKQNWDWGKSKREQLRTKKRQKGKLKPMIPKPNPKNKSFKNQWEKNRYKLLERLGLGQPPEFNMENWQTTRRSPLLCCSWLGLMWARWADDRGRAGVSWSGTWREPREWATAVQSRRQTSEPDVEKPSQAHAIEPFKLGGTGLSFTSWNNELYVSELFICVW